MGSFHICTCTTTSEKLTELWSLLTSTRKLTSLALLTKSIHSIPFLKMPEVTDSKNNTIVVISDHRIDKSSIIQGTYNSIAGRWIFLAFYIFSPQQRYFKTHFIWIMDLIFSREGYIPKTRPHMSFPWMALSCRNYASLIHRWRVSRYFVDKVLLRSHPIPQSLSVRSCSTDSWRDSEKRHRLHLHLRPYPRRLLYPLWRLKIQETGSRSHGYLLGDCLVPSPHWEWG